MDSESSSGTPTGVQHDVRKIRRSISSIYHDINNPISIVAGNTEILIEMAASAGLGSEFVDPLRDIGKATRQISEQVERLIEVQDLMPD